MTRETTLQQVNLEKLIEEYMERINMDYSKFYPEWFTKGRKPTEKEINKMASIARKGLADFVKMIKEKGRA